MNAGKRIWAIWPGLHLVNVLRHDLGLQDQLIGFRNNEHEGLARSDDAANGVNRKLVDIAGDRRLDHHAFKPRRDGELAFLQLGNLAFDIAQVRQGLRQVFFVNLQDLHFHFGNARFRRGLAGHKLAPFAVKPRRFAVHRHDAADGHKPLALQVFQIGEFGADQGQLLFLGNSSAIPGRRFAPSTDQSAG